MDYFASNIKYLRELKGLKQSEVCDSIGFKQSTWSGYEKGSSKPNFQDLILIIGFFEVGASDLLERDLKNVEVNKNAIGEIKGNNVVVKVERNVEVKGKKGLKQPCQECNSKDILIQVKDQLLHSKQELIEQLNTNIKLLQNHIDTMEYERREAAETQHTPIKERKTA